MAMAKTLPFVQPQRADSLQSSAVATTGTSTDGSMASSVTDSGAIRMTVAYYTADEVVNHFVELYNCLDFKAELQELGIGTFNFVRRKKALREFKALSIALWGLALQKSFPDDSVEFFAAFCATAPCLAADSKESIRLQERVNIYVELLALKKDSDFLPVALFMAETLSLSSDDKRRQTLKLSLSMRNLYMLIFDRLV